MPSPDICGFADGDWFEQQRKTLLTYSDKIESCICHSEWEMLAMVLESRQAYLLSLFSSSATEQRRATLKQLAESVLQQDVQFKIRVEEQKRLVAQQQKTIERRRFAVRAYNNQ